MGGSVVVVVVVDDVVVVVVVVDVVVDVVVVDVVVVVVPLTPGQTPSTTSTSLRPSLLTWCLWSLFSPPSKAATSTVMITYGFLAEFVT